MSDYVTMRSRIADEIADSALTTQVNRAIQDAIKHYERKRFYFNQTTDTFSTVANQEYYAAAANSKIPNIVTIDYMKVTQSSSDYKITPRDFGDIDSAQSGSITGLPRSFAYYKQQIRLYPIPDAVYTVTMAIHYRFTALSADADTNAWMTDGEALIRSCAKRFLAIDVTHELPFDTPPGAIEREALYEIECETRSRISNGRLRSDPAIIGSGAFNINTGGYA